MKKPKFKINLYDLRDFNRDCIEAVLKCPQQNSRTHGGFSDKEITLGGVKATDVVKHWLKNDTLFKSEYDYYLSDDSLKIFEKYREYKIAKKFYKLQKELKNEGMV